VSTQICITKKGCWKMGCRKKDRSLCDAPFSDSLFGLWSQRIKERLNG